jgi:multiple sugar transport system substrate-binding protein
MVPAFAADSVILDLWYNVDSEEEQVFFEEQVSRFNALNKNVQVNTLVLPQSAFADFVLKEAEENQLPDLLYFQGGSLSRFVWSGLLQPLDAVVSSAHFENVTMSVLQQGTYPIDGRIYALSPSSRAIALYGNRSLLKSAGIDTSKLGQAPWGTNEFHDVLRKLKKNGHKWPLDMQLYHADDEWYLTAFSPFFQASGGDIISRNKWDAHIALESLFMDDVSEVISPMLKNEWIVPSHKSTRRFEKSRAGLSLATTSHWGAFKESLGEDLVLLPFPQLGPHHVTSNGGWGFGVTTQTSNAALAGDFIEFIMSDSEVLQLSDFNLTVPATKSALAESSFFGENGPLKIPAEQFQNLSRPKPLHPAYPVIREAMADALDDILAGADFKIALAQAADLIDSDIESNDYYPPFNDM